MKKMTFMIMAALVCFTTGVRMADAGTTALNVQCTDCVNSSDIKDLDIKEIDIATDAVTTGKIKDGEVKENDLGVDAVTTTKIKDLNVTTSKIQDLNVTREKINNNAVNSAKLDDNAVTTTKIADGHVTDAKITGPISASKIEKPANVIIVAMSGGDFASVKAAVDSVNPTAGNPYIIKVMPGTYVENEAIQMKSYMHLQGSGRDVTSISSNNSISSDFAINIYSLNDVSVTGLTLSNVAASGNGEILISQSSNVMISDNLFIGRIGDSITCYSGLDGIIINNNIINVAVGQFAGIRVNAPATVTGNTLTVSATATGGSYGIYTESGSPIIKGNTITGYGSCINSTGGASVIEGNVVKSCSSGIAISSLTQPGIPYVFNNVVTGNSNGIYSTSTSGVIIYGNFITGNGFRNGSGGNGIYTAWGSPTITHNTITGNYSDTNTMPYYGDIYVILGNPNISFNVYDNIVGTEGVGQFNVKSDGSPAPAP